MVLKMQIKKDGLKVSRLRCITSQVVACMSPNVLLLDLGLAISFATIAVPDLLTDPRGEGLKLDETQVSWFGSIAFLTQPLGALLSGPIVDYFGRKKANFLVNIPHLIAWILMYFAWNVSSLFVAGALLGIGTGVMEAPINSYVGEISEPSIRGALCTVTQLFVSIGMFLMYFLGIVVDWRTASLICLTAPITSMLLILLVPDTPVWLLANGREKEALESLRYLRGWTSSENVRDEFDELVSYAQKLQQCVICSKDDAKGLGEEKHQDLQQCEHKQMNFFERRYLKFRYVMLCKETLRPLTLVLLYFTFYVMSGHTPIRPNMVNVCGAFGMPYDGRFISLMVGVITLITSIIVIGLIKMLGKRKLAISAMLGTAISCAALSAYAKINLSDAVFSYDTKTFPKETSMLPLVLFYMMTVFTGFSVPWVLLGEVFPYRSRASAQGIAAAGNYVVAFLAAKTFINLEEGVHLWGTFAVYAGFGLAGTIYLYFFLPETEGKTLHEIESYYNGGFRTFADDPVINLFKRFKR